MALIIAGDRSGVGKTTLTLAILAFLAARSGKIQSFKVGPDYIDPMFHTSVTGVSCRNLDPVLTSTSYVRQCFQSHSQNANWILVEGVMGLFDGVGHFDAANRLDDQFNDNGSTAHVARILSLPVALVLDCSRLSSSIAAIASGYANLDTRVNIAGVILNKVGSDRHLELLTTALNNIEMPILGVLRRNPDITLHNRHLGLIPVNEVPDLVGLYAQLANLAEKSLDWSKLMPLLGPPSVNSPVQSSQSRSAIKHQLPPLKLAIAKDKAFNFYYQDNLDILRELGAELIFWSPLGAKNIPSGVQGLYFGGGFPEVFVQQLAENHHVLHQLRQLILTGIPTYAECGGLMYLCQELIDLEQKSWSMVGAIPSSVTMEARLTLGYRQAKALQDSCLVTKQQTVKGHEFHHSQLTLSPQNPLWQLQGFHRSSPQTLEGWQLGQLHASYLHVHWGENIPLAARFIQHCRNYKI